MGPSNPAESNGDPHEDAAERAPLPDVISSVTPEDEPATEVADRRVSPRRKKLVRIAVRNEANGETIGGWVLDRSLGGLCISTHERLEAGAMLAARRASAPESMPWVELRVLNVREQETTCEIGCEYVHTPSWEVLLQFE